MIETLDPRQSAVADWLRGLHAGGYELSVSATLRSGNRPAQLVMTYVDDLEQVTISAESLDSGPPPEARVEVVARKGRHSFAVPCGSHAEAQAILTEALASEGEHGC